MSLWRIRLCLNKLQTELCNSPGIARGRFCEYLKSKKTTSDSKWKSFFCPHRFFSANLQKLHGFENGIAVLVEKG